MILYGGYTQTVVKTIFNRSLKSLDCALTSKKPLSSLIGFMHWTLELLRNRIIQLDRLFLPAFREKRSSWIFWQWFNSEWNSEEPANITSWSETTQAVWFPLAEGGVPLTVGCSHSFVPGKHEYFSWSSFHGLALVKQPISGESIKIFRC